MSNALPLVVTVDRDRIRAWADRMGLRPALSASDARMYPLALADGALDPGMTQVGWDEFFAEFEKRNVAFVYRAVSETSPLDNDWSFVSRTNVPELTGACRTTVLDRVI